MINQAIEEVKKMSHSQQPSIDIIIDFANSLREDINGNEINLYSKDELRCAHSIIVYHLLEIIKKLPQEKSLEELLEEMPNMLFSKQDSLHGYDYTFSIPDDSESMNMYHIVKIRDSYSFREAVKEALLALRDKLSKQ